MRGGRLRAPAVRVRVGAPRFSSPPRPAPEPGAGRGTPSIIGPARDARDIRPRSTRLIPWRWGANRAAHRRPSAPRSRRRCSRRRQALLREGVSYADLNIERIATRAGISRTAFYFYFRDKRELLLRLTEDVTDELYRQGDIWFSGAGEPRAEVGEAAVANIGALYREHGAVLRAIVQAAATDDEVAVFWHAILDRFVDATARRIEDAARGGQHRRHRGRARERRSRCAG